MMEKNKLTFLSLWSINDELNAERLQAQLLEMKQAGLDGVIFHPRHYPNRPMYLGSEYMNIVSRVIEFAKSISMYFWIYDENGWPSGTAGGEVLATYPELQCQWIEMHKAVDTTDRDPNCLHSYAHEGERFEFILRSKQAVSSLDSKACHYFIELTHKRYKDLLSPEAFAYVTGFFADEVAFLDGHSVTLEKGAIPWSETLEDKYEERYGEQLAPQLHLLFIDEAGSDIMRARFWELVTDALNEGFYQPHSIMVRGQR